VLEDDGVTDDEDDKSVEEPLEEDAALASSR
jgi:hypothetical protein